MTHSDLRELWGTDAEIARRLKTSRQLVRYWRTAGAIPWARQCAIQVQTRGRLRADAPPEEAPCA